MCNLLNPKLIQQARSISVIISLSHCSFPPLVPGSPGLHSVVAEARSQDLILLVVRDLSNLSTVGVLKAKGQGSSNVMKQFLFNRFSQFPVWLTLTNAPWADLSALVSWWVSAPWYPHHWRQSPWKNNFQNSSAKPSWTVDDSQAGQKSNIPGCQALRALRWPGHCVRCSQYQSPTVQGGK